MATTKVWAVGDSDYEGFSMAAAFETEVDAEAAKERGMGNDVVEMDFYAAGVKPQKTKWVRLVVWLDVKTAQLRNGHHVFDEPTDVRPFTSEVWRHPGRGRVTTSPVHKRWNHFNGVNCWQVEVEGPDNDCTRKVFYDLVAKTRAEILDGHR